jgi:hypothetical protein
MWFWKMNLRKIQVSKHKQVGIQKMVVKKYWKKILKNCMLKEKSGNHMV